MRKGHGNPRKSGALVVDLPRSARSLRLHKLALASLKIARDAVSWFSTGLLIIPSRDINAEYLRKERFTIRLEERCLSLEVKSLRIPDHVFSIELISTLLSQPIHQQPIKDDHKDVKT